MEAARVAGIQAAKQTSSLIPLCHPIRIDRVIVDVEVGHHGSRSPRSPRSSIAPGSRWRRSPPVPLPPSPWSARCSTLDPAVVHGGAHPVAQIRRAVRPMAEGFVGMADQRPLSDRCPLTARPPGHGSPLQGQDLIIVRIYRINLPNRRRCSLVLLRCRHGDQELPAEVHGSRCCDGLSPSRCHSASSWPRRWAQSPPLPPPRPRARSTCFPRGRCRISCSNRLDPPSNRQRDTRSTTPPWGRMRSRAASREARSKVTCSSAPRRRSTRPWRDQPTGTGFRGTRRSVRRPWCWVTTPRAGSPRPSGPSRGTTSSTSPAF